MKIINYKISREDIYTFSICLYFSCSLITITMFDSIRTISIIGSIGRYLSYILFFLIGLSYTMSNIVSNKDIESCSVKEIMKKIFFWIYNNKILLFSIALGSVIMFFSKNKGPLVLTLILWSSSFFDFNRHIKKILIISSVFFLVTIIFEMLGILPDIIITRNQNIVRHSLGYIYPLEFMSHFIFIIFMIVYVYAEKINITCMMAILVYGILMFEITDSRTSFYILVIFLLLFFFIKQLNLERFLLKIPKSFYIFFTVMFFVIPIILTLIYNADNNFMFKLNGLLSDRLNLGKEAIINYGITFFGEKIKWIGFGKQLNPSLVLENYNFVDCWYIKNLLDHGIIYELCVLIGYIYIVVNLYNKRNIIGILIIFSIMTISFLEPRLMNLAFNPFVLMMSGLFNNKNVA